MNQLQLEVDDHSIHLGSTTNLAFPAVTIPLDFLTIFFMNDGTLSFGAKSSR